jgi:cold shock CspA family protein
LSRREVWGLIKVDNDGLLVFVRKGDLDDTPLKPGSKVLFDIKNGMQADGWKTLEEEFRANRPVLATNVAFAAV